MSQDNTAKIQDIKPTTFNLAMLESIIEGKVAEMSEPQNGEYRYFVLNLPAFDAYSLPPVIQLSQPIKERNQLRVGEFYRLKVRLSGYPRRSGGNTYYTNVLSLIEVL